MDIHRVAAQFGHRIVWTVRLDTGPLASALILAGTVVECAADAVVVPGFEHADTVRHTITDLCALITPMQVYPRGYRWPVVHMDRW
jgi:membrane protein YdbS with pleckstrin-like domain